MSVQTAQKVVWKKYKVAVPQDSDRQTSSPLPGECVLTSAFQAGLDESIQPCGSGFIFYTWRKLLFLTLFKFTDSNRSRLWKAWQGTVQGKAVCCGTAPSQMLREPRLHHTDSREILFVTNACVTGFPFTYNAVFFMAIVLLLFCLIESLNAPNFLKLCIKSQWFQSLVVVWFSTVLLTMSSGTFECTYF